jgi:hypothetical protein
MISTTGGVDAAACAIGWVFAASTSATDAASTSGDLNERMGLCDKEGFLSMKRAELIVGRSSIRSLGK